jgi:tetratricopeptide (TPR) repeat protein
MKRLRQLRLWGQAACVVWICGSVQVHAAPARATPAQPSPDAAAAAGTTEQQRMAGELSKAGRTHYREGRYGEAVAAFERALDLYPNPTLLFNLAQAHRHNGSAENAIFFFKRYLVMVPRAPDRADVEMRIHYLEQTSKTGAPGAPGAAANSGASANNGPTASGAAVGASAGVPVATAPVGGPSAPPSLPPASASDSAGRSSAVVPPAAPVASAAPSVAARPQLPRPDLPTAEADRLQEFEPESLVTEDADPAPPTAHAGMRLLGQLGLAHPQFGGAHGEANSNLFAFAGMFSVSHSVPLEFGSVDFGLATSYSPIAYYNANRVSVLTHLIGGFVTGGLHFSFGDRFSIGPALALGVVWWSGLGDGNFFTGSAQATDGAAAMPSVRLGLPLLWRVGSSFLIGVEPAWAFSKTTNVDLSTKTPDLRWFSLSALLGLAL